MKELLFSLFIEHLILRVRKGSWFKNIYFKVMSLNITKFKCAILDLAKLWWSSFVYKQENELLLCFWKCCLKFLISASMDVTQNKKKLSYILQSMHAYVCIYKCDYFASKVYKKIS